MLVFGIPAGMILVWYFYILATEVGNAPKIDAKINMDFFNLPEIARKEGFDADDFTRCQNIVDDYTTTKGAFYAKETIHQLLGLPGNATEAQYNQRCIFYAKTVKEMRKVSLHVRHVFVCGESVLNIAGPGDYFIKPDPKGRGALQNMGRGANGLLKIGKKKSAVIESWHVYNVGDGCLIVGLSKAGTFRMSASVSKGQ
ncbi:MAG: hypothetical protein HN377_03325 [Alphaproteobacteria bacterium]|nr:hypothetical protein [Alphaproteobacteria bacterium]